MSTNQQIWPDRLFIVRHGESAGNVAREAAALAGDRYIDIDVRDVDVPLSELGKQQAEALGRWFASLPEDKTPNIIVTSPYLRARDTADIVARSAGLSRDKYTLVVDERLREKEFGILDGLTTAGIHELQPDQAEFRKLLGKFYHRPPGGESWADVIFRLRALMDTVSLHYGGRRVMIVAHQVVVLCLRYVIENLTEAEILAIDKQGDVANCAITEYAFDASAGRDGGLVLARYNVTAPMEEDDTPVTAEPDQMVAARG